MLNTSCCLNHNRLLFYVNMPSVLTLFVMDESLIYPFFFLLCFFSFRRLLSLWCCHRKLSQRQMWCLSCEWSLTHLIFLSVLSLPPPHSENLHVMHFHITWVHLLSYDQERYSCSHYFNSGMTQSGHLMLELLTTVVLLLECISSPQSPIFTLLDIDQREYVKLRFIFLIVGFIFSICQNEFQFYFFFVSRLHLD